jgi:hypothetical protein
MDQNRELTTPAVAGQKLPVPMLTFEVAAIAVPIQQAGNSTFQDKLRDDLDFAEKFRNAQRPARWSALNEF